MFWSLVYFPDICLPKCTFTSRSKKELYRKHHKLFAARHDQSLHMMKELARSQTSIQDPQCSQRIGLRRHKNGSVVEHQCQSLSRPNSCSCLATRCVWYCLQKLCTLGHCFSSSAKPFHRAVPLQEREREPETDRQTDRERERERSSLQEILFVGCRNHQIASKFFGFCHKP